MTQTETVVFVYSNGKRAAEYSTAAAPANPTTSYTATDMLGSPRVLTDSLGNVVSRRDFLPFGEEISPDGSHRTSSLNYNFGDGIRQKFTGYQRDEETNLDFAEARYYNNQHGRFTAVDPLLASGRSSNPQTFNRYVYVLNNPLILTDPKGLQAGTTPTGAWYVPVNPPNDQIWRARWIALGDPVPTDFRPKTFFEHVFQAADTGQWQAQNPINGATADFADQETAIRQLNSWTNGVIGMKGQEFWENAKDSDLSLGQRWGAAAAAFGLKLASIVDPDLPPGVQTCAVPSGKSALEQGIVTGAVKTEPLWTVYLGRNAAGQLYPGITMRQLAVREAEHIATGGAKATLQLEQMATANSALGARIAEQKLMNELGGKAAMESRKLLNIRNAVAPKFWPFYNILPPTQ